MYMYSLVDVGGQQSELRKWIQGFNGMCVFSTCIASRSAYNFTINNLKLLL